MKKSNSLKFKYNICILLGEKGAEMKKITFAILTLYSMMFLYGWDETSSEARGRRGFKVFEVDYQKGDTIRAYVQYPKSTRVVFKREKISRYELDDDRYFVVNAAESHFGNKDNALEIDLKEDAWWDTTSLKVHTESGKVFRFQLYPIPRNDKKLKPDALIQVKSLGYVQKSRRFYWWDSNKRR